MALFSIESVSYRASDCLTEIIVGTLFGLFSAFSFFGFFPMNTLIFFLIPCVFIFGWIFMKIDVTPERLILKADIFEYYRGNKKIFSLDSKGIKDILRDEGEASQTLYDKRLIIYFIDNSECSYPYRYFSEGQLKAMRREINEHCASKTQGITS